MNTTILIKSFSYVTTNYKTLVSISTWIHKELEDIKYKKSKFEYSLQRGDIEVITELMSRNKDPNIFDEYLVLYPKHREMIKLLILNGVDIYENYNIFSLVENALNNNDCDLFEFMLQNNIKLDNFLMNEFTEHGKLELIKLFETYGFESTDHMIMVASKNNKFHVVEYLMDKGLKNHYSLMYGWKYGNIDIVRRSFEAGLKIEFDISIENEEMIQNLDIFNLILDHNNNQYEINYISSMIKCIEQNRLDIIKKLFKESELINNQNCIRKCTIHNNIEILKFFLERVRINEITKKSSLIMCRINGNQEMMNLFFKIDLFDQNILID